MYSGAGPPAVKSKKPEGELAAPTNNINTTVALSLWHAYMFMHPNCSGNKPTWESFAGKHSRHRSGGCGSVLKVLCCWACIQVDLFGLLWWRTRQEGPGLLCSICFLVQTWNERFQEFRVTGLRQRVWFCSLGVLVKVKPTPILLPINILEDFTKPLGTWQSERVTG